MSLISFVATSKFISFCSDGRVISDEQIIDENYKKITIVNNRIILGITGCYNASRIINENLANYNNDNAKSFATSMFRELGSGKINRPVQFVVGGLDDTRNIYYAGFSERDDKLTEIYPSTIRHGFMGNQVGRDDLLKTLIEESLENEKFSLKEAREAQIKFNKEVSKIDGSVNNNLFTEYININDW